MVKTKLKDKMISSDVQCRSTIKLHRPDVGPTLEFRWRRCQPMPMLGQRKHASWGYMNAIFNDDIDLLSE